MVQDKAAQNLTVRIGGLLLAASAFSFIPIIYEYVFVVGAPSGTGQSGAVTIADAAAHASSHWELLSSGWRFEIFAMALIAAAAITLTGRPGAARPGWALVTVGALITSPMYALMLGGYDAALNGTSADLALYGALRASAFEFFYSGIGIMRLGLAAVFIAEFATRSSLLWRGLFILGFLTNFLHGVFFIALFWGASVPMAAASPIGILAFILTGVFGLKLAFTNRSPVP